MTTPPTPGAPVTPTKPSFVRSVVATIKKVVQPYFTHASGQALAWYTIATHDLTKWESAAAAAGALALTSFIKKVSAWLGT
jgi:hypothetical protein